jgi:hypothetical protein
LSDMRSPFKITIVSLCGSFINIIEPEFCPQKIAIELGYNVMKGTEYFLSL